MKKVFYDIEVYPNYWLLVLMGEDGRITKIDSTMEYQEFFDKYRDVLKTRLWVGFNNVHYDQYILELIMSYSHDRNLTDKVYQATQDLIVGDEWGVKVLKKLVGGEAEITTYQLDLMGFNPQRVSLKELGVRIHHEKLETLPIAPETMLSIKDYDVIREYCVNDVTITKKLHDTIYTPNVEVKHHLVNSFNLDPSFYSKSDRVITEHILCKKGMKAQIKQFNYHNQYNIDFKTPEFEYLEKTYENIDFDNPDISFKETIDFGELKLDFALGGIHGVIPYYKGKNLIDIDVASYYPNLIRNLKALPQTVDNPDEFYKMIDERVALKKTDPAKATAYKVVINTVYGALNYSSQGRLGKLYDLEALYTITITGQLLIAKLIEDITEAGYKVVYANTDGIMIEDNGDEHYKEICKEWEERFNLTLEFDKVKQATIRDVNNFIIQKDDGKLKLKGEYNYDDGSKWGAYARIADKAVVEYIINGTPIADTVKASKDIRDFILYQKYSKQYSPTEIIDSTTRKRTPFNNVLRFYLSNEQNNYVYAFNTNTNNTISREHTQNISSIPEIPSDFPSDLDYNRYIEIAYDKLEKLTNEEISYNPYIEGIVEELKIAFS